MLRTALLLAASAAVWAQQPNFEFEVASIHPAGTIQPVQGQQISAGVHIDGAQMKANFLSLRDFLCWGFNVKPHQLQAPDWATNERFNISATMPPRPEGKTFGEQELATMMRKLLEERFHIKSHKESREFPVYALVQAKTGIKAKENALDPLTAEGVTIGGTGSSAGTAISLGRGATMTIDSTGNRIAGTKLAMQVLADTLGRFVELPVVDRTGLTATYDVSLQLTPEDFRALMIRAAMDAGVTLPPQALKLLETASLDSLHEALAQVGLKLERSKTPMDVVVIDSLDRAPSEN